MQRLLEVTVDGKWGPQSRAAAMKKYGISDPAELYKILYPVEPPEPETYDTVVRGLNELIGMANDPNSKTTMETLGSEINALLKDAYNDGTITKSEYNKLWSLYQPIGNAYN